MSVPFKERTGSGKVMKVRGVTVKGTDLCGEPTDVDDR